MAATGSESDHRDDSGEDHDLVAADGSNHHRSNNSEMFGMASDLFRLYDNNRQNGPSVGVTSMSVMNIAVPTSSFVQEPKNIESQIFVRSSHGTCLLNTNTQSSTVEAFKCLIEERQGIPIKDQYLIHGGKPLRDGTWLRDYAIRDESTVDVLPRIRGGASREDLNLDDLSKHQAPLTKDVTVSELPGLSNSRQVLSEVGVKIIRGIMSYVVKNHKAKLAFRAKEFTAKSLRVSVVKNEKGGFLWETAYVKLYNIITASDALTDGSQRENYEQLRVVIEQVLRRTTGGDNEPLYPLHVEGIDSTLKTLQSEPPAAGISALAKRTQLLEALAATVDPVQMASMWWNLVRFQDSLKTKQRVKFRKAVESTKYSNWAQHGLSHSIFSRVYNYPPSYGNSAMDLLFFARNWFTHVPKEQWNNNGAQVFQGLPHLDYIFTHHFILFMPNLLLGLYEQKFDLTEILVPLY